jgi:hypothetical protein
MSAQQAPATPARPAHRPRAGERAQVASAMASYAPTCLPDHRRTHLSARKPRSPHARIWRIDPGRSMLNHGVEQMFEKAMAWAFTSRRP